MISSNVVSKDILRKVQSGTLSRAKAHLIQSFGPMGSYTCVGKGGGKAIKYTKDGHSILSELSFTRPIEATVIDALTDITRNTVKTVGDGTTSAVVLSSIIFEKMTELETRHKLPPSKMIDVFKKVVSNITEVVESGKKETAVEDIYKIAYVSTNGNEEVANVIRDIYEEYGMEVFIDVAISTDENSHIKIYDGMTMEVGYAESCFINHPKGVANINHPNVYTFQDPIDTPEMVSFLDQIIHDNIIVPYASQDPNVKPVATVIIAPKISRDFATRMDQITDYMAKTDYASKPPLLIITNITDQAQFLDIADMCGAKLIKKYNDPRIQELDIQNGLCATLETVHQFAGQCEMVESSNTKSKFINPALMFDENGEHSERFKALISWLEAELAKAYEEGLTTTDVVKLKRRINSLKANLVEYQIGGISISDRDSLRDLVEDAVLNCRSAAKYGYGYGAKEKTFFEKIKEKLNN